MLRYLKKKIILSRVKKSIDTTLKEYISNMKFTCYGCKKQREDEFINVSVVDVGHHFLNAKEGEIIFNLKYCNDNDECLKKGIYLLAETYGNKSNGECES